jgi:hypothetical protein
MRHWVGSTDEHFQAQPAADRFCQIPRRAALLPPGQLARHLRYALVAHHFRSLYVFLCHRRLLLWSAMRADQRLSARYCYLLAEPLPVPGRACENDAADDFFRVRLICTLLDTCGMCFDKGSTKKKLDQFLVVFQVSLSSLSHAQTVVPLRRE